jgi:hypothetical protein
VNSVVKTDDASSNLTSVTKSCADAGPAGNENAMEATDTEARPAVAPGAGGIDDEEAALIAAGQDETREPPATAPPAIPAPSATAGSVMVAEDDDEAPIKVCVHWSGGLICSTT